MSYQLLKSLHFIGVISWFAGLFYIVRLFIYHVEAMAQSPTEATILTDQFKVMERRLWFGITWPACIVTWLAGLGLAYVSGHYQSPWFHQKLVFLLGLQTYHFYCGQLVKQLKYNTCQLKSHQLRIYNEVATLLMVILVVLAVYKNFLNVAYAIAGFLLLATVLMAAIQFYRKIRGT